MAEAHSAVAFSFTVTPEGVDVNVNHDALWAVWISGWRSWKKRCAKIKVNSNFLLFTSNRSAKQSQKTLSSGSCLEKAEELQVTRLPSGYFWKSTHEIESDSVKAYMYIAYSAVNNYLEE